MSFGEISNWVLDFFWRIGAGEAGFWLFIQNVLQFAICLIVGEVMVRVFAARRTIEAPEPLEAREVWLAISCVVLNTTVAWAGWWLWHAGVIRVSRSVDALEVAVQVVLLLVAMDFLMYVTHRLCHAEMLFPFAHQTHHLYDKPRPLSLFVLNPIEVFGFGALWLLVLSSYSWSWMAIVIYLLLNAAFGTLGHLGVEPFPRFWNKIPILGAVTTSTFHGVHHQTHNSNFGFYTNLWDRLFGTLHV